jgi:DNA-binding response OmpR family regulator
MATAADPQTATLRVLVVDDDEDLRLLVATRMERHGHEVMTARNGTEALAMARAAKPDVAILDVMMPEVDGFAVTRELRADERTKGMTIVILSGRAGAADREFAFRSGADDYLLKPFDPKELYSRVLGAVGLE